MKMHLFHLGKRAIAAAAVLGLLGLAAGSHAADTTTVRLGTLAPRGSTFHKSLQMMGEQWRKASDGQVKVIIYPDGVQGSEADMVRKIRANRLNAGLFTAVGLAEIEPAVTCLQNLPMMFRTLEELDYVTRQMQPVLEKKLLEKGFVVLFWGDAGWVRYFSSKPIVQPDDMKPLKLFVWAGDSYLTDLWRSAGYKPYPLETADMVQGFRTGLIEAAAMPPVFAVAGQIYDPAPYMLELNWAPLVGACVVSTSVWDTLTPAQREAFFKAAQTAGREIKTGNRKENEEAVQAMVKRGLKVTKVTPEVEAAWRGAVEPFYAKIRGPVVPPEMFDQVQKLLEEYRATGGKQ